ncbi:MAG TPA: hypothetical protein VJ826_11510 [Candidatus Polarisedimenticolaceae bacterium]|nr:hypothetical protein [Candidatus Polarisedimenticolaceae bacterium]
MPSMAFGTLWMPVLASGVAVFVVSSILHMALRYHRADHKQLPGEDSVREALGKAKPAPGIYMTPFCNDMKEMSQPAVQEKFTKGPVAIVTVMPNGMPSMGKLLGLWFGFAVFVSFTAAYIARHTLMPGADGMTVMRITGTVAFAGYGLGQISDSIWKAQPWSNTMRFLFDSLIYGVVTGLIFKLLWPSP